MVRSPSGGCNIRGVLRQPGSDHVRATRNLLLGDDPISFVDGTIRLPARHRVLHGCSWRFPFDCGAKTVSPHDQSGNCHSRCKRSAPLQLMENSKWEGRDENPRRSSRCCAGSGSGACRCGRAIHSRIRRRRRYIADLVKAGLPGHAREKSIELCHTCDRQHRQRDGEKWAILLWVVAASAVRLKPLRPGPRPR